MGARPDGESPAQMDAVARSTTRPEIRHLAGQLFERGLQQRSDTELRPGAAVAALELIPPRRPAGRVPPERVGHLNTKLAQPDS